MIGIYKITSPSGKIYIGQSVDIEKRWKEYKKLRCKRQPKLHASLTKHTPDSHTFEIIEECLRDELDVREIYWGEYYNVIEQGLNHAIGYKNQKRSKESCDKISIANTGKIPWNKGKTGVQSHSKETREKIAQARLGKSHSQETLKKISDAHIKSGHVPPSRKNMKKKVAK
jgi:group I intron endonuclease